MMISSKSEVPIIRVLDPSLARTDEILSEQSGLNPKSPLVLYLAFEMLRMMVGLMGRLLR